MHDQMGGDIPVIIVDWNDRTIGLAMDYWVNLSKGIWTDRLEERDAECEYNHCNNSFMVRGGKQNEYSHTCGRNLRYSSARIRRSQTKRVSMLLPG